MDNLKDALKDLDDIGKLIERIKSLDGTEVQLGSGQQSLKEMQLPLSKRLAEDKEGADIRTNLEKMQSGKAIGSGDKLTPEEEAAVKQMVDDQIRKVLEGR